MLAHVSFGYLMSILSQRSLKQYESDHNRRLSLCISYQEFLEFSDFLSAGAGKSQEKGMPSESDSEEDAKGGKETTPISKLDVNGGY